MEVNAVQSDKPESERIEWLLGEVASWERSGLLTSFDARRLHKHYTEKLRQMESQRHVADLLNKARQLIQLGRSEEAIHALEEVVAVDPSNLIVNSRLAQLYEESGETARALEACRRRLRFCPHDSAFQSTLRRLEEKQKAEERKAAPTAEPELNLTPSTKPVAPPAPSVSDSAPVVIEPSPVPSRPAPAPETERKEPAEAFRWITAFLEERNIRYWHLVGSLVLMAGVVGLVQWQWGLVGKYVVFGLLLALTAGLYALGYALRERLKLSSVIFIAVGSLMVPCDFAAANAFVLFGRTMDWNTLGCVTSVCCLALYGVTARWLGVEFFVYLFSAALMALVHFALQLMRVPYHAYGCFYLPVALAMVWVAWRARDNDWHPFSQPLFVTANVLVPAVFAAMLLLDGEYFVNRPRGLAESMVVTALGSGFYVSAAHLFAKSEMAYSAAGLLLAFATLVVRASPGGTDWHGYLLAACVTVAVLNGAAYASSRSDSEEATEPYRWSALVILIGVTVALGADGISGLWRELVPANHGQLNSLLASSLMSAVLYRWMGVYTSNPRLNYLTCGLTFYAGFLGTMAMGIPIEWTPVAMLGMAVVALVLGQWVKVRGLEAEGAPVILSGLVLTALVGIASASLRLQGQGNTPFIATMISLAVLYCTVTGITRQPHWLHAAFAAALCAEAGIGSIVAQHYAHFTWGFWMARSALLIILIAAVIRRTLPDYSMPPLVWGIGAAILSTALQSQRLFDGWNTSVDAGWLMNSASFALGSFLIARQSDAKENRHAASFFGYASALCFSLAELHSISARWPVGVAALAAAVTAYVWLAVAFRMAAVDAGLWTNVLSNSGAAFSAIAIIVSLSHATRQNVMFVAVVICLAILYILSACYLLKVRLQLRKGAGLPWFVDPDASGTAAALSIVVGLLSLAGYIIAYTSRNISLPVLGPGAIACLVTLTVSMVFYALWEKRDVWLYWGLAFLSAAFWTTIGVVEHRLHWFSTALYPLASAFYCVALAGASEGLKRTAHADFAPVPRNFSLVIAWLCKSGAVAAYASLIDSFGEYVKPEWQLQEQLLSLSTFVVVAGFYLWVALTEAKPQWLYGLTGCLTIGYLLFLPTSLAGPNIQTRFGLPPNYGLYLLPLAVAFIGAGEVTRRRRGSEFAQPMIVSSIAIAAAAGILQVWYMMDPKFNGAVIATLLTLVVMLTVATIVTKNVECGCAGAFVLTWAAGFIAYSRGLHWTQIGFVVSVSGVLWSIAVWLLRARGESCWHRVSLFGATFSAIAAMPISWVEMTPATLGWLAATFALAIGVFTIVTFATNRIVSLYVGACMVIVHHAVILSAASEAPSPWITPNTSLLFYLPALVTSVAAMVCGTLLKDKAPLWASIVFLTMFRLGIHFWGMNLVTHLVALTAMGAAAVVYLTSVSGEPCRVRVEPDDALTVGGAAACYTFMYHLMKLLSVPSGYLPLSYIPIAAGLLWLAVQRRHLLTSLLTVVLITATGSVVFALGNEMRWVVTTTLLTYGLLFGAMALEVPWRLLTCSSTIAVTTAWFYCCNNLEESTGQRLFFASWVGAFWGLMSLLMPSYDRLRIHRQEWQRWSCMTAAACGVLALVGAPAMRTQSAYTLLSTAVAFGIIAWDTRKPVFAHASFASVFATYALMLVDKHIQVIDAFLIPVGVYVTILGWIVRRTGNQQASQPLFVTGLLTAMGSTFVNCLGGDSIHAILLTTMCLVSVFLGIANRLKMFAGLGVSFLIALAVVKSSGALISIHWAVYATVVGIFVIASATFFNAKREAILHGADRLRKEWEMWS